MKRYIHFAQTALLCGLVLLLATSAFASSILSELVALETRCNAGADPASVATTQDFNEIANSSWSVRYTSGSMVVDRLSFGEELTEIGQYQRLATANQSGLQGGCYLGSQLGLAHEYFVTIVHPEGSNIDTEYFAFNIQGNSLTGTYSYKDAAGDESAEFILSGNKGDSTGEPHTYYVPFIPQDEYFLMGLALANIEGAEDVTVSVDYFSNDGQPLGQQNVLVPAFGQTSLAKNVSTTEKGWARINTNGAIRGLALMFGQNDVPMFDVDMQSHLANILIAPHADSGGGWVSTAMLCNPNPEASTVTLTLHPSDGSGSATKQISIPAMGSVQYRLEEFSSSASSGAVWFESTQKIAGFMLFDGMPMGRKWLSGLSIQPVN